MATKTIKKKGMMECRGRNVEFLQCNVPKDLELFYDSWSPFNIYDAKSDMGRPIKVNKLPFCRDCCNKLVEKYKAEGHSIESALYFVASLNNLPYIGDKVKSTFDFVSGEVKKKDSKIEKIFGSYYSILARETSKHQLWQDFSCTDIDFKDIATKIEHYEVAKKEIEQLEIDWGKQEPIDYMMLQETYDRYTKGVEFVNPQQEDLYRDLCRDRLILRKMNDARYSGEETMDKVQNRISRTMATLKVDDFESNKPKTASEQSFFAKIAQIEQTKPADLYKEPQKYSDFNKFKKYERDLVLRPLLNTLCGHRDFDISIDDVEQYELRE